jgi:membrane-bound ClpP family serine protease
MSLPDLVILFMLGVGFVFPILFVFASVRIVPEDKRLIVYRLGRYIGDRGPGLVLLIPVIDRGILKDFEISPQSRGKTPGYIHAQQMLGWGGETMSKVFRDGGQVLLHTGEKVDAISETPLRAGTPVRVKRIIVEVESTG